MAAKKPKVVPKKQSVPKLTLTLPMSVQVELSQASDTNDQITEYEIQYANNSGFTGMKTSNTGVVLKKTVSDLSLGAVWYFRIRAKNVVGWSIVSDHATMTIPNVPSKPTITSVTNVLPKTCVVYFTPPANGGSAITGYTLHASTSAGFTSPIVVTDTTSPIIFEGVVGVNYYIRLQAKNSQGSSVWSDTSQLLIPNVPSAMVAPTLSYNASTKETTVTFTAPANGGAAITNYEIEYADNNTFVDSKKVYSATSPRVIGGFLPGKNYWFRVKAQNSQGWGPLGASSNQIVYIGPKVKNNINVYQRTLVYVNDANGNPKLAIPYVNVDGTWRIASA